MEQVAKKIYYAASTGGFYDQVIHAGNIPSDAVEIAEEQRATLLAGQETGKIIAANANGYPVLQDPPPPTIEQISAAVTAARSAAYVNESDPLFFKAQRGESTMDEWLAKVDEIKARYPEGIMPQLVAA